MRRLVCDLSDVPEGEVRSVQLEGLPELAVCNVEGRFHILAGICSHGASSLGDGRLLGCEIECVLHKGRFDVATGKATRRPAKKPVAVYECVVDDGRLFLVDESQPAATNEQHVGARA
jgi:nitrite reductase/ring-hydroxylating ferredoxin subunit